MTHHKWLALTAVTILVFSLIISPTRSAQAATKTWDGGGDGTSWSDANNWSDNAIPAAADQVILDNSLVAGSYTINLPAGATTTTIARLTITPDAGNTITLVLPSGNTGAPGLNVGDATAGTDDIILDAGAVLRNSSGASSGNGIQANSTSNGTVRINDGGRYVHNTGRSTGGIVPLLSTAAGTELGVFEYDSPGTGSVSISASGRNYGTLILTRSAGAATYSASGSSALTVRGHFTVNSGVTFNSSMTGAFNVGRDFTNNGVALTTPAGQAVNFTSTSSQSIAGSGTTNFGATMTANGTLALSAGATVSAGGNVTVAGALAVNGTLKLTTGSITAETTFTNNGTLVQARDVSAGTQFLFVRNAAVTTTLYYGVIITPTTGSMGTTTVTIKGNQTAGCTSNSADPLIQRCFRIDPTTPQTADIQFYYTEAERNGQNASQLRAIHYVYPSWLPVGTGWVRSEATTDCQSGGGNACWMRAYGVSSYSAFGVGTAAVAYPTAVRVQGGQVVTLNPYALAASALLALIALLIGGAALRRQPR